MRDSGLPTAVSLQQAPAPAGAAEDAEGEQASSAAASGSTGGSDEQAEAGGGGAGRQASTVPGFLVAFDPGAPRQASRSAAAGANPLRARPKELRWEDGTPCPRLVRRPHVADRLAECEGQECRQRAVAVRLLIRCERLAGLA